MKILLIDTCGEAAGVALCVDGRVERVVSLPERKASSEIVSAVRALPGDSLCAVDRIAVVSGPGSFTGVRTGLAAAKGFAEATGLGLVEISRLAVLARKSGAEVVALYAGRNELYVREGDRERLSSVETLREVARGRVIGACEERVRELLGVVSMCELSVADALPLALEGEPVDAALIDGNYVRAESDIYRKAGAQS